MAQLVYKVRVTDHKGKVHEHDAVVGGGHMTAEDVAAHFNDTGHFDKLKPKKIVIDPEPIGETNQTVAQVINRQGKITVQRVKAEVAPRPQTEAEVAEDVDLERSSSPTLSVPITEPVDDAVATLPPPTDVRVDEVAESPVAEVAEDKKA